MAPSARAAFRDAFAAAVNRAVTRQGMSQQDLAERIAQAQYARTPYSRDRDRKISQSTRSWASRISQWKKGTRLPTRQDDLLLALGVIAPGDTRNKWMMLWAAARAEPAPVLPIDDQVDGGGLPAAPAARALADATDPEPVEGDELGTEPTVLNRWRHDWTGRAAVGLS